LKKLLSINAYILCGGISKRMNTDKALLEYNGKKLIDITIECCAGIFDSVFLVGREYQNPLISGYFGDEIKEIGPLGGIYTALKRTDKENNFFVGLDYPFIDRELILSLTHIFMIRSTVYEGCIPIAPDGMHPLFAYYSRSCIRAIRKCIGEHNYRIRCMARYTNIYFPNLVVELGEKKRRYIERCLINVNRNEDYYSTKFNTEKEEKFI
jgi:molybdopterin-guanine dinucleotide biosynthesis protein A